MKKLLFVWNADGGRLNGWLDIAHKIFSPTTYPCSLCDLTHGVFKIKSEWADFVEKPPIPFVFLHRDEFHDQFSAWKKTPLPAIFLMENERLSVFFSSDELSDFKTIGALKSAILEKLFAVKS